VTRRFPNGATRLVEDQSLLTEYIGEVERTGGSEPSQYPQEKKVTTIASVAASERARA
jgi:hypothetical protein